MTNAYRPRHHSALRVEDWPDNRLEFVVARILKEPDFRLMSPQAKRRNGYPVTREEMARLIRERGPAYKAAPIITRPPAPAPAATPPDTEQNNGTTID